jgi:hypothetical protein
MTAGSAEGQNHEGLWREVRKVVARGVHDGQDSGQRPAHVLQTAEVTGRASLSAPSSCPDPQLVNHVGRMSIRVALRVDLPILG